MAALCSMGFILSEFSLNLLSGFEELAGREGGFHEDDTIEKLILRLKTPRLCFHKRGLANHQSYPFAYQRNRLANICFSIAKITPKSQIHLMYTLHSGSKFFTLHYSLFTS